MADLITINGVETEVTTLPATVQKQVGIFRRWETELAEARLEALKTESAMNVLAKDIIAAVEAAKAPASQTDNLTEAAEAVAAA
jgi:hypothetical protein